MDSTTSELRGPRRRVIQATTTCAALLLGAGALASPAIGAEDPVPCGTPAKEAVYTTVTYPAVPAVYETVTTPATTDVVWSIESPGDGYVVTDERWVVTQEAVPAKDEVPEITTTEKQWFTEDPAGDWTATGESRTVVDQPAVQEQWVFRHVQTGDLRYEDDSNWNANGNANSTGWVLDRHIPGSPEVAHQEYEYARTVIVQEYEPGQDAIAEEGYTEYEWTKHVPESTVTREVSPAVDARTEQVLVSEAVPAGPPCEEPPIVTPGQPQPPVQGPSEGETPPVVTPAEPPEVAPVEGEQPAPVKPTQPTKPETPVVQQPDEIKGEDTEKPRAKPVVAQPEALPTAVDAGFGPAAAPVEGRPLGQGMVGGGLLMLLLAGAMQMGRRERGAREF